MGVRGGERRREGGRSEGGAADGNEFFMEEDGKAKHIGGRQV